MKLSLFNRPHVGTRLGFDPYAIAAGVGAVAAVVLFYPQFFVGG